jgi:hypothetical protein
MNIRVTPVKKFSLSTVEEELFREDPLPFPVLCLICPLPAIKLLMLIFSLEIVYIALELLHVLILWHHSFDLTLVVIYVVSMTLHIFISTTIVWWIKGRPSVHLSPSLFLPHLWIFTRSICIIWDLANTTYGLIEYIPCSKFITFTQVFFIIEIFYSINVFYHSVWILRAIERLKIRNPWSPSMLSFNPTNLEKSLVRNQT